MNKLTLTLTLAAFAGSASALTVSGVDVPETADVSGQELVLNGAGLRTKYVLANVYVAGLYLPERSSSADSIIDSDQTRRISLFMKRDLDADTFMEAFHEGLENNLDNEDMQSLGPKIDELDQLFAEVGSLSKGDRLDLRFTDDQTEVSLDGELLDTVDGAQMQSALIKSWLGEQPAQDDLKSAMLGQ